MMTKNEIGQKIKERRKIMAMPQSQLANYTGLSVVTLSQIENGKANPSLDTLNEIFHFLNLEILVVVKNTINEVKGNI
jgi:transcriptional regulator with XRE-family HTH domain